MALGWCARCCSSLQPPIFHLSFFPCHRDLTSPAGSVSRRSAHARTHSLALASTFTARANPTHSIDCLVLSGLNLSHCASFPPLLSTTSRRRRNLATYSCSAVPDPASASCLTSVAQPPRSFSPHHHHIFLTSIENERNLTSTAGFPGGDLVILLQLVRLVRCEPRRRRRVVSTTPSSLF